MSVLLYDLNNLAIRSFCTKEVSFDQESPNIKIWKYFVIDSIYKSLFKNDVTEVILAVDSPKSWRKLFWERYKESRKSKRDKSNINWDVFHKEYRYFTSEIEKYLPFKIIQVDNAEADDVIGILSRKDNQDYIVISNDEDYLQLISNNIKVYNPNKMEYMSCNDTEEFIVKKCLIGQPKDDIFNIKTPIDWPNNKRKPGFGEVSAKKVMNDDYKEWLKKNDLEKRFNINRILIDFNLIPKVIKNRIMNEYNNYKMADPSNFYQFFHKNNFAEYLNDFSTVESKLLTLY